MAESVVEDSRASSGSQRPKRRSRVSSKRKASLDPHDEESKKRRTFNNFYTFCSFVLEYEEKLASESTSSLPLPLAPHSPINSAGESSSSSTPSSSDSSSGGSDSGEGAPDSPATSSTEEGGRMEYTSDDDSWNLVTCFCRRPFAGRPMIECSKCQTWIHLFCAKIRKDHVPEVYVCPSCTKTS